MPQQRRVLLVIKAHVCCSPATSCVTFRQAAALPPSQSMAQVSVSANAVRSALQVWTFFPEQRFSAAPHAGAVQTPTLHNAAVAQVSVVT